MTALACPGYRGRPKVPPNAPQRQLKVIKAGDYGRYALETIGSVPAA